MVVRKYDRVQRLRSPLFEVGAGVAVVSDGSAGNSILGNSIFQNCGLGVNLGDDGPTPNNGQVLSSGPNDWQNFPVITSVVPSGDGTSSTVYGTLSTVTNANFRLELFANLNTDLNNWTNDGTTLLQDALVSTDAAGNFSIVVDGTPQDITATATTANNGVYNTSEFSYYLGAKVQIVTYGHEPGGISAHRVGPDSNGCQHCFREYKPMGEQQFELRRQRHPPNCSDPSSGDQDYPLCYTRSGTDTAGDVIMTTDVTIHLQQLPSALSNVEV